MIRKYEYGQRQRRRLTPEGIYSFNLPREQTIELLKREATSCPTNGASRCRSFAAANGCTTTDTVRDGMRT